MEKLKRSVRGTRIRHFAQLEYVAFSTLSMFLEGAVCFQLSVPAGSGQKKKTPAVDMVAVPAGGVVLVEMPILPVGRAPTKVR